MRPLPNLKFVGKFRYCDKYKKRLKGDKDGKLVPCKECEEGKEND